MRKSLLKSALMLTLAAVMMMFMTACGSGEKDGVEAGAWEVVFTQEADLPDDARVAYDRFMADYEGDLKPVAYIGRQIVAGTNYELICYDMSDEALKSVCVYEDLEGNTPEHIVNDFDLAEFTEGDGAKAGEELAGGWQVPENYTVLEVPEEIKEALSKASNKPDGNELIPMALLGTQVVSGNNYAILCHSATVTAKPVSSIQLVTLYVDMEGNAEISNIYTLDPGQLNE